MTPLPVQPDPEVDSVFDSVLEPVTEYVVRPIVRRKLNVSLQPNDTSRDNQDALELVGDVQVALLVELSRTGSVGDDGIRDIKSYAATVTSNACYQYFRSKHPVRTQQKNKIRYLLTHSDGFTIWKERSSGKWACGYPEWEGIERPLVSVASERAGQTAEAKGANERDILLSIIRALFDELGGPVSLEDLTAHVMAKRGLQERVEIPEEPDRARTRPGSALPSPATTPESQLEEEAALRHLWGGVLQLPLRHRKALLLNLKDSEGWGLITVLPASGVAGVIEIAEALDFSPEQFAEIWHTLPWSDLSIADHLRLTRQQVINLRQTARARLARLCGGGRKQY